MKWSKYNYVLNSHKYGVFIYNSTTNSFIKINEDILKKIHAVTDWNSNNVGIESDLKEVLLNHKIIVDNCYDYDYLCSLKYLANISSFSNTNLNLTIATTTNCNFKCAYCYESGVEYCNMSEKTEDDVIKFIGENKLSSVTWYGGEPLLNFGTIVRLTDKISKLQDQDNIKYSVVTNGYYLDEEKCRFFAANSLNNIQITIDGNEETHNNSRIAKNGEPTYQIIVSNIDRALTLMPNTHFSIRVNIGYHNKDEYPILYKELSQRWKQFKNISIYMSFIEDYNVCNGSFLKSPEKIDYLKNLSEEHGIHQGTALPKYSLGGCIANSKGGYVISPNGDLYKCWSDIGKESKKVGNISNPTKRINSSVLSKYAVQLTKFEDKKCLKCAFIPVCDGGCVFHKYENIYNHGKHEICPYKIDNIDKCLEWVYENYVKSRNSTSEKH